MGPIFLLGILAVIGTASYAQAGPLQDIPTALADYLEVDSYVAEAILATMILTSVALVLAVAKLHAQATVVMLIVTMGALVAISWLDTWVLVLVAVLAAALFGKTLLTGLK